MSHSDPRQQLLTQIRALRRRVDPAVLQRVLEALPGWERYDREAAQETVALFLKNHKDSRGFLAALRHGLAAESDAD